MRKLFSIEGPIAVGKSTLLHKLSGRLYRVYQEPVDLWEDQLLRFYKERTPEVAIQTQRFITTTMEDRHKLIRHHMDLGPSSTPMRSPFPIMERSVLAGQEVFAKVSSQTFPHPDWEDVEEEMKAVVDEYEGNVVVRIALHVDFETTMVRSLVRQAPDADAHRSYLKKIYDASVNFESICTHVVQCEGKTVDEIAEEVQGIIHLSDNKA